MLRVLHAAVFCCNWPRCSHTTTTLSSYCCFYYDCHGQDWCFYYDCHGKDGHIWAATLIGSDCVGFDCLAAWAVFCPWGSAGDSAKTTDLDRGQSGLQNLLLAFAAASHGDCTIDKKGSHRGRT